MIYNNMQIHNVAKIIKDENTGGIRWLRVPEKVYDGMESQQGKDKCFGYTGVELRFVMKSDTVTIRMHTLSGDGLFHVYRGSMQGGWDEQNKTVGVDVKDYVIKKSPNMPLLKKIARDFEEPFSPEVVRVIFDKGTYEIIEVIGEIEPPQKEQLPPKTLLAYGSSITHGSNSLDMSHSWVSVLAHNLKMDARNLGMAGSCLMEHELVEYIAEEGKKRFWDVAILELGINALDWDEEKITDRVDNTLEQVAGKNPEKPVILLSPLYNIDDYNNEGKSDKWRKLIECAVNKKQYKNVLYINGLDVLDNMSFISADEVHPNIYGVARIAKIMEEKLKKYL